MRIIDKTGESTREAVGHVRAGDTVLISGFGDIGVPYGLIDALIEQQTGDLTVVANNAGSGDHGIAGLLRAGLVSRIVCSYPRVAGSVWFEKRFHEGSVELDLVPQGTLAERIRAAGAGIAAFYTRTGAGTDLATGHEARYFDGREYILQRALHADIALVRAHRADLWGNLTYHGTARNYGPVMATAANHTIAEVDEVVPLGGIDPEHVVTPSVFVDSVVRTPEQER